MKNKLTIILCFIFLLSLVAPHPIFSIQPITAKQRKELQQIIGEGNEISIEMFEAYKKYKEEEQKSHQAEKEAEKRRHWEESSKARKKYFELRDKLAPMRKKAIELVDKYFKIDGSSARGEPKWVPFGQDIATTKRDRTVELHRYAFLDVAWLASCKLHEFTHCAQIKEARCLCSGKERNMAEVEAYDKELKNAKITGLDKVLLDIIKKNRKKYYDALSEENKKKVDKGIYIAGVIPLKDATENGTALARFTGKGRAAGIIFDLEITRTTPEPFTIEIALGTLIIPGVIGVQIMMVGQDMVIELSKPVTTVEVLGYCLNPELLPPPSPKQIEEGQPTPDWTIGNPWENPMVFLTPMSIIKAGNALSAMGQFHKDLPPQRHLQTVIQRAIWYESDPKIYNKDKLHEDITEQVEKTGGKQTPEQIEQFTNNLWVDIDLTLKESKKYH
jgi:hypothetical protein